MDNAELARLKAEAAAAAARAARAEAEAAEAALQAALLAGGENPSAEDTTPAEPAPSGYAATVAEAYRVGADPRTGVQLGAMIDDNDAPLSRVQVGIPLATLNRHGLIAGATGTGKTRTLQLVAENLSTAGVPVFLTDVKGDLTGLLEPGQSSDKLVRRTQSLGQQWQGRGFPVELMRLGGDSSTTLVGTPIRTSVTDFGPLMLSRVLGLNDTQESALSLIFHWADTQGLELIDLNDIRATVDFLTSAEGKDELRTIGGISSATAGVILREIAALQAQGADQFFGDPAFDTVDLLRSSSDGMGVITALQLPELTTRPELATTLIMWLLADLFSALPEVGDLDKPKLVFFFDEAHLLFRGASKAFLDQVINTVRLIRSKGVGIVFITQSPTDLPAEVLAQLGARVQHALRAFTPKDAKNLKATVETYPTSPLDLEAVIRGLGTGDAVVTVLSDDGAPTPVAPVRLRAPQSVMGPASADALQQAVASSSLAPKYANAVDPRSAYEKLAERTADATARAEQEKEQQRLAKEMQQLEREQAREEARRAKEEARRAEQFERERNRLIGSVLRSVGGQLGREITRSVFGTSRRR